MRGYGTCQVRTAGLVAAGLALMFALPTGVALHCNGEITEIIVDGQGFYIDDRSDQTDGINHWTYLESNGQPGLQSGGKSGVWPGCISEDNEHYCASDGCLHPDPDLLIL